jgi:hypothetical protein
MRAQVERVRRSGDWEPPWWWGVEVEVKVVVLLLLLLLLQLKLLTENAVPLAAHSAAHHRCNLPIDRPVRDVLCKDEAHQLRHDLFHRPFCFGHTSLCVPRVFVTCEPISGGENK